ncbi:MAG TPA: hypothetical protein VGI55_17000 [Solirubrobacteraceae bacterium]
MTTDLDRAVDQLSDRCGLERVVRVPSDGAQFFKADQPAPFEARFAMGARGGLVVELIEPVAGSVGFYRDAFPTDNAFSVRLHHLGTFIPTGEEEWDRLRRILAGAGLRVDYTFLIPGRVRAAYVDTRSELGHFLEVCQIEQEDLDRFNDLSSDRA